jgi:hypothetical protein
LSKSDDTKTFQRKTIEEVIARLADLLGTTDKQTLKLMSQLTEYDIEEILYALDIHNTYGYEFLNTYVYDKLGLNVSLARAGRTEIKEIAKTPFQEYGSENEKTRLQKLRDLFR